MIVECMETTTVEIPYCEMVEAPFIDQYTTRVLAEAQSVVVGIIDKMFSYDNLEHLHKVLTICSHRLDNWL